MNVSFENVDKFYSEFKLDDKDINFLKSIKEVLSKEKEIMNDLSEELQNNRFMIIFNKLYIDQLLKSIDMYLNQIYEEDNYIENMQLLSNLVSITKNKDLINLLIEKWIEVIVNKSNLALKLKGLNVIEELLKIHESILCCKKNVDIKELEKGFQTTINKTSFRIEFLLAKYINLKIIEFKDDYISYVDNIILLSRQLESINVFLEHYRQYLSFRLLNYEKELPKIENMFINKLTDNCGEDDTKKMVEMIHDFELSLLINNNISISNSFQIRFSLISFDNWPKYPSIKLKIPEEIINAQTNFQQVFKEKEKIRKLEWIPILSNCSFHLNNYNIKGSIIYYLIIEALINNNSLDDIGLSKEEISSSISILKENNIITQNQDHYKITCIDKNSIDLQLPSFLSPHRIKNKETEELFQFRKMKIECAIV